HFHFPFRSVVRRWHRIGWAPPLPRDAAPGGSVMVRMWLAPLALAAAAAAGTAALDDGRLDPAWFGGPGVEFRETGDVDYVWMKPGFTAEGHSFWIKPW